ncbi:uncharacterized protein G2W53_040279 [Senna tora]|uniref:Uncharacterized protein n=1 Tax=Senna tora TaxID=362788 RepID=A0A834SP49_9FABA|nr:uncharacterized protein G2W53_040279 [Senna tora]
MKKDKFKRAIAQVSENDRFELYLGVRVDLMLSNGVRDHLEEELKKYKFKRVVAQVSQTDRFALYLGIEAVSKLERVS